MSQVAQTGVAQTGVAVAPSKPFFSTKLTGSNVATPMFVFLCVYTLFAASQLAALAIINNNYISKLTNTTINFISGWIIALGIFVGITLIIVAIYLFATAISYNIAGIIRIWFILMLIVNFVLLGFEFYFLSTILNSADYTSTDATTSAAADNAKNGFIFLLIITGIIIIIDIIALVYYSKYKQSTFGISSFFGGGAKSVDEWLRIPNNRYESQQCKKWYKTYKDEYDYLKSLSDNFGYEVISNPKFLGAIRRAQGASREEVNQILNPPPQTSE
jgi:hypothetical protein